MSRRRIAWGLAFGLGLAGSGCFEGLWLAGRPCTTDEDCGPALFCAQGFCGGPQCPIEVSDDGVCPCPGPLNWSCAELSGRIQRKVDVLLVIDNSYSQLMSDQARVAALGEQLHAALDETLADYRVGITTTDLDNPACSGSTPELGRLMFSSCRTRLNDFDAMGTDARPDCIASCKHDALASDPTPLAPGGEAKARPWLEGNAAVANVATVSPGDALACLVPQGISGCGYGQPLEAMSTALDRIEDQADPAFGFLRDDAHLLVLLITDALDCSYRDEDIFMPTGGKQFWSDPEAGVPTPAVCFNAGVACTGGPGTYESCDAVDLGADGSPVSNLEDAVLHPVSGYIDRLDALRDQKQVLDAGLQVVVSVITGVPTGYPEDPIVFADAGMAFSDQHGIGPGCGDPQAAFALPPVRLRAVAEAFAPPSGVNLHSACSKDDAPALDPLRSVLSVGLPALCMDACVQDFSESVPGVQPECELAWLDDEELVEIPHCGLADGSPALPEGAAFCYHERVGDQIDPDCTAIGSNMQFDFLQGVGVVPPGPIFASCAPSGEPDVDCPGT